MSAVRHYVNGSAVGAVLAALPLLAVSSGSTDGIGNSAAERSGERAATAARELAAEAVAVTGRPPSGVVNVDGSLPQPPRLRTLFVQSPPSGPHGIPATALAAYRGAAQTLNSQQPGCHIDWALLASVGRIESNHARGGYVDSAGNTREPILGPVLNGSGNVAAIPDTDDGRLDGNTEWDRAVGPAQFIPSTWQRYAADANGDGVSDPHNIHDAMLAAGRYLCSGDVDLAKPEQLRAAVFRYNHSASYVDEVLVWAEAYRDEVRPLPDSEVPLAVPTPVVAKPAKAVLPPESSSERQGDDSGATARGARSSGSGTSTPGSSLPNATRTTSPTAPTSTTSTTTGPTSTGTTSTGPTTTSRSDGPTMTTTTTSPSTTTSCAPDEQTSTTSTTTTSTTSPTSSSTASTSPSETCDTETSSGEATSTSR